MVINYYILVFFKNLSNALFINNSSISILISSEYIRFYFMMLSMSSFAYNYYFSFLSFFDSLKYNIFSDNLISNSVILYSFTSEKIINLYVNNVNGAIVSLENFFYSIRWQEREVSEFSGLSFSCKRDSRSLFLYPSIGSYPLKKDFPCIGFYEISNNLELGLSFERCFFI